MVPFADMVVATASSCVIRLKEPRYVIAIVPMLALVIGLSVDRGRGGASLRRTPPAEGRGCEGSVPSVRLIASAE